jgi:hypothetical protein
MTSSFISRRRAYRPVGRVGAHAAAASQTQHRSGQQHPGRAAAIANAERARAASHAGVELGEARGKLAAAQRAANEKHDEEQQIAAQQFADEARAEAELAAARADAFKANAVNQDIKRSTATLVEEMQRKTGDSK